MKKKGVLLIALVLCLLLGTAVMGVGAAAQDGGEVIRVGWVLRPGGAETHNGEYSGYDYDYLMEIADYTGWTYEFVEGDFAVCSHMLETGEIDILGNLFYSEETAQVFDFPQLEYGYTYTTLFSSASGDLQPYDFAGFNGITVGVISGSANITYLADCAAENGFHYEAVEFDSVEAMTAAVLDSSVDAGILSGYIPLDGARVLAEFAPIPYYFATTKGNETVLVGLNRALNYLWINEPYLEIELYDKYFGHKESLELTQSETKAVEESRTEPVTVGLVPDNAPMCYWNEEKGEFDGIFVELMRLITEKTGLQFEFVSLDVSEASPVTYLKQGVCRLVSGILRTENFMNDSQLVLSDTITESDLVIVGRIGADYLTNPAEKTLAMVPGFQVAGEYVAQQFSEHKIIWRPTLEACLDAIESGEADATVYLSSNVSYLLHNPHYENLEIYPAYQKHIEQCAAGLSGRDEVVIGVINKGLAMISESELGSLLTDFTLSNPYQLTLRDTLYKYRTAVVVIVALLLAVIGVLTALFLSRRKSAKQLKAAFEQEKQALLTAEKASEAKGNFMSRVSHEIRTPLNAVIGYNSIARSEMTGNKSEAERRHAYAKVLDCLSKSDVASKNLLTIINDVLDMSAIESGKLVLNREPFDFKNLISSVTVVFYSQATAKGVGFEVVFDGLTEEWFIGDQTRISQILNNLMSNAVKFTPAGGSVRLTVSQKTVSDKLAGIRFVVSDTGIGMDKEYLETIWTPFEQEDPTIARRFGGTGLGLSITKSLIDLLGGSISVESQKGVGSTFTAELTLERTEQPDTSVKGLDFSDINALVVDDDLSTREYVKLLFDRCGARCKTVESGPAAVDAVKNEEFSLCIVDWIMPDMDGLETVRQIRKIVGDDLPIIIVTAYDYSEIDAVGRAAGVNMFVSKPLFQSTVFDMLANICGSKEIFKREDDPKHDFGGAKVILAEDNIMNMEVAKFQLAAAGLDVSCAWNGAEAVALFSSSPAGFYKAILMDIQMPEMDGHEAARAIRASDHPDAKTIPIIAMTADAFAEKVTEALASGMNDHIPKPINMDAVCATLKKYIK